MFEHINLHIITPPFFPKSQKKSGKAGKRESVSRNHRDDVRGKPKRKKFVIYLIFRKTEKEEKIFKV